jgi:hypothetical protein
VRERIADLGRRPDPARERPVGHPAILFEIREMPHFVVFDARNRL